MEAIYRAWKSWANLRLFKDTYKSSKIKIGVNEMTVNDGEMCVRWNNEAGSIPEMSVLR